MATIVCRPNRAPVESRVSDVADRPMPGLARALAAERETISEALYRVVESSERTAQMVAEHGVEFVLRAEKRPLVDYLVLRFETGDSLYEELYAGEKLKQLQWPMSAEERRAWCRRVAEGEQRVVLEALRAAVSPAEHAALAAVLARIYATLTAEGTRVARVLLIGDCLHLDVVTFAQPALAAEGITLEPTFLTSKNPVQLRREIDAVDPAGYAAVFYSPFTYEFDPALEAFQRLGMALRSPWRAPGVARDVLGHVQSTLAFLVARFECPIVVHNTALVARTDGSMRSLLRREATAFARRRLARSLNRGLATKIDELHRGGADHLHLLDETSWVRAYGEARLSRYLHAAEYQHPATLGRLLADAYVDVIAVVVGLFGRKLVACDLDNTLWEGVIGEGAVRHHRDRQEALLALKQKGVVLAVNSKNDPANVRFDGGLLCADDFVHREINWDSKVKNMGRIAATLNLKAKDFVFVDDRADERAMVAEGVPGALAVDATDERTWRRFRLWADMLISDAGDRTELYRQQRQRQEALAAREVDETALLQSLQIMVAIREAEAGDLKRVAELVNRTNQFNLQGSRTTAAEVQQWHGDPATTILLASASDKFGSNGVVCVAVARHTERGLEVPVFVLSCRVFGFEIERAVMNHIKRSVRRETEPIVARLVVTPHNGPCHAFLPRNGFEPAGEAFIFAGTAADPDPPWLAVETHGRHAA